MFSESGLIVWGAESLKPKTQPNAFGTLAEAYTEGIRDLLKRGERVEPIRDPLSIGSRFGKVERPTIEIVGHSFQVDNPFCSLFQSEDRLIRIPYCIGLFLWSVTGSDELEWISYYNASAQKFSDDGAHLFGAFGKRLFGNGEIGDQIRAIRSRLIEDPTSRRTIGAIATAEDNIHPTREYPCCIAVQYLLRRDSLCAITFMRSQSALMVLPYDAFLFMALQCFLASQMGVTVGYYRHISASFHIYEDELELARRIANKGVVPVKVGVMEDAERNLRDLRQFERKLRRATVEKDREEVEQLTTQYFDPTSFFGQGKTVLAAYSLMMLGMGEEVWRVANSLPSPFKKLVESHARKMGDRNE